MSVLATITAMLRLASRPFLSDVVEATSQALILEKDPEVRRGAVFLFARLFESFEMELFTTLALDVRKIYRTLKWIATEDEDPVTQFHATSAIAELVRIARDFLTPAEDPYDFLKIQSTTNLRLG